MIRFVYRSIGNKAVKATLVLLQQLSQLIISITIINFYIYNYAEETIRTIMRKVGNAIHIRLK